jgi:DNA segregation ATPase FtsK/SpoIIIE-like protein
MAQEPKHRHNGGPLSDEDRRKFWAHIRALEVLEEQKADIMLDVKCRKELAKADGFDTNIMGAVLKRRKAGEGETLTADALLRLYEDALRDQGVMPLEQTRQPTPPRRTVDEIADQLHGEPAPDMPERGLSGENTPTYDDAKKVVLEASKPSTSFLQRQMKVGYNQASCWIEQMEAEGLVTKPDDVGRREVIAKSGGGMFDPADDF